MIVSVLLVTYNIVNSIIRIYRYVSTTCSWVESFPTTGCRDVAALGKDEIDPIN